MTKEEKLQRRIDFLENEIKLMMHDNNFWEHLTDHIMIAISFTVLGFLLCTIFMKYIFFNRIRIDYELQKGIKMRMFVKNRKWIICNPKNIFDIYDSILFSFFDKGVKKLINKYDEKKIKLIRIAILTLSTIIIIVGTTYVLSASALDVNPFNYLLFYLKEHLFS